MAQVFVALVHAVSSDSVETWVSGGGGGGASAARGVMLTLFIALDDGEARGAVPCAATRSARSASMALFAARAFCLRSRAASASRSLSDATRRKRSASAALSASWALDRRSVSDARS